MFNNSRLLTRLPPARGERSTMAKRRYIIYSDQISDLSADRLTKGRPKSFEDIGYRSIRCLICVETWASTSSIVDNGSVIVHGSDDHEACHSSWPILIGRDVYLYLCRLKCCRIGIGAWVTRNIFISILSLKTSRD